MSSVKISGLCKSFNGRSGRVEVLKDFSLDIAEGELLCLLGPSGCGKTTLVNLIAGMDRPEQGKIEIRGGQSGKDRKVVVVFQEPSLFPWLTVLGNVEFGMKMIGKPPSYRKDKALEYLTMVGLSEFAHSYIHELSGGMKQRAALARAMALDPDVLLMDEPFGALDPNTRNTLQLELLRIVGQTGKTVLFITHSIDEALLLGDRVVLLMGRPGNVSMEFRLASIKPRKLESNELRTVQGNIMRVFSSGGECWNDPELCLSSGAI